MLDLLKRYSHIDDHDETRTIRAKLTGQLLRLDPALQDKPRQSLLYEFGELSGPYPLYSSLLSNHAAQQQKETLMLKKRGMDM